MEPYGFIYDKDDRDPKQDVPLARYAYASYAPIGAFFFFRGGERKREGVGWYSSGPDPRLNATSTHIHTQKQNKTSLLLHLGPLRRHPLAHHGGLGGRCVSVVVVVYGGGFGLILCTSILWWPSPYLLLTPIGVFIHPFIHTHTHHPQSRQPKSKPHKHTPTHQPHTQRPAACTRTPFCTASTPPRRSCASRTSRGTSSRSLTFASLARCGWGCLYVCMCAWDGMGVCLYINVESREGGMDHVASLPIDHLPPHIHPSQLQRVGGEGPHGLFPRDGHGRGHHHRDEPAPQARPPQPRLVRA